MHYGKTTKSSILWDYLPHVTTDVHPKSTNKSFDEIKKERGIIRQIAMDLLYRVGGLSGTEIGEMMGVDYSTVSLWRKRLRERLKGDKHLSQIIKRVEADLSTIKIDPFCSLDRLSPPPFEASVPLVAIGL